MAQNKILVVDDDQDIREVVSIFALEVRDTMFFKRVMVAMLLRWYMLTRR